MLSKILGTAREFLHAVSPIDLFNAEQISKLNGVSGFKDMFAAGFKKARAARAMPHPNDATIKNYFQGYNLGDSIGNIPTETLNFRKNMRITAASLLGAYIGSKVVFGGNNPVSETIGYGARVGTHATIGAAIHRYVSPAGGLAYLGLSGINLLRDGDNLGPL